MTKEQFDNTYIRLMNVYNSFAIPEKRAVCWELFQKYPVKILVEFVDHVILLQDGKIDVKVWLKDRTNHKIREHKTMRMLEEERLRHEKINFDTLGKIREENGVSSVVDLIGRKI